MNIKSNLQNSFSDQKSRVLMFFMVGAIVVISAFYYITVSTTKTVTQKPTSNVKTSVQDPTKGVASVPGTGQTTEKYKELQKKYEQKELDQALKKAESGTPSAIVSSLDFSDIPEYKEPPKDNYQQQLSQRYNDQVQKQQDRQRERDLLNARKRIEDRNKQILNLLGKQASVLAKDWRVNKLAVANRADEFKADAPSPMFLYMRDKTREITAEASKPSIYYKAGDILFGVILTSVNSDQPGPVLVRLLSGPLNNSKMVGVINPKSIPQKGTDPRVSQALVLEFNLVNIPGTKNSIPIRAVAIDPQTARTSLATSVDNHYLTRYGTFFAAEFLAGLGRSISQQTATTVVTGTGTADIGRTREFSGTDEAKMAIGSTAAALSETLNFLDRPPTIEIAAGTAVGILLQEDLVITSETADLAGLVDGQGGQTAAAGIGQPTITNNGNESTSQQVSSR